MRVLFSMSTLVERVGQQVVIPFQSHWKNQLQLLHPSILWSFLKNIEWLRKMIFFLLQIKPYVSSLAGYLPKLWVESEDHNMLRCSILVTLSFIVKVWYNCFVVNLNISICLNSLDFLYAKGLGADSIHLYPFLTPVIQLSTDVTQVEELLRKIQRYFC